MRSLLKAATYLLYCNPAASLVIPSPAAFEPVKSASPIIEYVLSSTAQLKFSLNNVDTNHWETPALELEVGSTARLCAETNVTLNGESLATQWNGIQGHGEGNLKANGNAPVSWTVTCLWDSTDDNDDDSPEAHNITHLLILKFKNPENYETAPGFTVSYKTHDHPSILRFDPRSFNPPFSNAEFPEWRTAVFPFASASLSIPDAPLATPSLGKEVQLLRPAFETGDKAQKTLGAKFRDSAKDVIGHLKSLVDKYCPKKTSHTQGPQKSSDSSVLYGQHHNETRSKETQSDELEEPHHILGELDVPSAVRPQFAAETRSLHPTSASASPSPVEGVPTQHNVPHALILKLVFLLLLIGTLISLLIIRLRDPRRRAERAARREERQNRRLYKCAARRQKYETMVWNFRVRWGLVSPDVLRYDEKQRRVEQQESVLEDGVKDEIQALREAHRVVSSTINAAASSQVEEGRSGYVYEEDGYGHRRLRSTRSVVTLPEYRSEVSRPPSYRSRRGSGTDFNSDSSVVSTSPRISRDGTSSDLDEKIEELDLRDAMPRDFRPRV